MFVHFINTPLFAIVTQSIYSVAFPRQPLGNTSMQTVAPHKRKMSDHNSAVFNNSCLKVPRNPVSKQPFPVYDQKYINQLENQARKLSLESNELDVRKEFSSPVMDRGTLKSLIAFYDSIPDYDDVNHLSNMEFYRKLEMLKEKQRTYFDYIQNDIKYQSKNTTWIDDYKNLVIGDRKHDSPKIEKSNIKSFCATPMSSKPCKNEDVEWIMSSDKEMAVKPPSRRSVRIESPSEKLSSENSPELNFFRCKSRANISSAGSKGLNTLNNSPWDDISIDDFKLDSFREPGLTARSAPNSPCRSKPSVGWKESGITIPKPFQMTVRDEENKIVNDIMATTKKPADEKQEMFRAHPVPIESQIPLFDKIMSDQEKRRQKVRRRSKAALKAQMRPFSFTRRDEEIQAISKKLSKSSPCIFTDDPPIKIKPFKAKPIPKNLFSNYIYHKMHEDEFYRALQKKIRAEEMLKAASLPPSMAKREKRKPKHTVCPRSFRDFDLDEDGFDRRTRGLEKYSYEALEKELDELDQLENEFIRAKPYKSKTRRKGKRGRHSSAESKSTNSSMDFVNRSNLAAVLRIQSARKRLELEMCKRLEEAKLREEARWKEKVLRKRPVWQSLAHSHEEDLAMRLQLRRDEEKLRNEEHRHRMQMMLGRVNQQPTLFERQSKVKNAKSREELISKLYKDFGRYSASPKFSDSSNGKRSFVEMKDEAVQAKFDEIYKDEEKYAVRGEDDCNFDD